MKDINFSVRSDGFADKIFLERWSPRSFLPEVISSDNLKNFDAARWSPLVSTSNRGYFLLHLEIRNHSTIS